MNFMIIHEKESQLMYNKKVRIFREQVKKVMAYTALYREWRPRVFSDVIGQEHITTTLINEIKANRIGHAYLFSGTRGTGKTTCAKIMGKSTELCRSEERRTLQQVPYVCENRCGHVSGCGGAGCGHQQQGG